MMVFHVLSKTLKGLFFMPIFIQKGALQIKGFKNGYRKNIEKNERRMIQMKKWFDESIRTLDELRKQYKKLLLKYHPDCNGGDEEITKQIIQEYDCLFKLLQAENDTGHKSATHDETAENEAFKAVLNEIIGLNMTVEIIGSWIWCFDCYQYKGRLKELGFKWCSKKKAWVWHNESYNKYHKKEIPLSSIRQKYGSEIISKKSKQAVIS